VAVKLLKSIVLSWIHPSNILAKNDVQRKEAAASTSALNDAALKPTISVQSSAIELCDVEATSATYFVTMVIVHLAELLVSFQYFYSNPNWKY
jgi:hypothetical protein